MTALPPEAIERARAIGGEIETALRRMDTRIGAERGMAWMMELVCEACGMPFNGPYRRCSEADGDGVNPIARAEWFRRQEEKS